MMFIHFNYKIVNTNSIDCITCDDFVEHGHIHVHYFNEDTECVYGVEALNLIMNLAPGVLEGKKAHYYKNAWVVHNIIGHPAMQFLSWFGFSKAALWVHEKTIPTPIVKVHHAG